MAKALILTALSLTATVGPYVASADGPATAPIQDSKIAVNAPQATSESIRNDPEARSLIERAEKAGIAIRFHQLRAGTPGPDGWVTASSTEGKFTVDVPGPFNDLSMDSPSPDRVMTTTHTVGCVAGGTQFAVVLSGRPDGKTPPGGKDVPAMVADYRKQRGLKQIQELRWEGHPGFDVTMDDGRRAATIRLVSLGEGRTLMLIAEHKKATDRATPQQISRFMNSVKLEREVRP